MTVAARPATTAPASPAGPTGPTRPTGLAELSAEIQQFYARQMQLLDDGEAEAWAETFAEDGVFAANAHPEPFTGRPAIAAGARRATDDFAARGIRRRHWLGMLSLEPKDEHTVFVRSYAQVIETARGGQSALRASTTCADLLVRRDGRWLVLDRRIHRDDLD
ncbi:MULTISPECIES: nuclear transport factor 2 family protein [Streptomyces]|uniref:Nuclear transport factor 2 family protein n=1 Tax=Streptomyces lonegramiae TaxID=3075524 RepID=A0ABU2XVB3_9ACTN|nr:nuclear transport factor 2 family protein [Streptomyces sp. DSM 41529]MDT0549858.1 nuclear transport factor 2 family protein [Streptomyces sp. DSM 41529]